MTVGERDMAVTAGRSRAFSALHGLRRAADSLDASMHGLVEAPGAAPIDVERLCTASYSAGRLVGYLEALAATDAGLAQQAALELGDVMASVDAVREKFKTAS